MAGKPFDLANEVDGQDYHHFWSMVIVLVYAFMCVCTFAIVIPTSKDYVATLGGQDWFSGLSIGITVIAAGIAGFAYKKIADRWGLKVGIALSCVMSIIGAIMYALAGYADSLALLLIGRVVQGFGSNTSMRLSYLGCSVSTRKLTGIMSIEAACQSLAYAGGPLFAYFITLFTSLDSRVDANNSNLDKTSDYYLLFNEGADAGWFMAAAWVLFMVVHCLFFVEPDLKAGFSKSDQTAKGSKANQTDLEAGENTSNAVPSFCSLKWSVLVPLQLSMFVMPMVFGAFEVVTVEVAQISPLGLPTEYAALYLAGIMFICASMTVTVKPLLQRQMQRQKQRKQLKQKQMEPEQGCTITLTDRNLVLSLYLIGTVLIGLVFTVILEPVYSRYTDSEPSWQALLLYAVLVSLVCTALNIARAASTALLAKPLLIPAEYRDTMAVITSFVYLVGRGVGPLVASAVSDWITVLILTILCFLVAVVIFLVYSQLDTSVLDNKPEIEESTRASVMRASMRESQLTSR